MFVMMVMMIILVCLFGRKFRKVFSVGVRLSWKMILIKIRLIVVRISE